PRPPNEPAHLRIATRLHAAGSADRSRHRRHGGGCPVGDHHFFGFQYFIPAQQDHRGVGGVEPPHGGPHLATDAGHRQAHGLHGHGGDALAGGEGTDRQGTRGD